MLLFLLIYIPVLLLITFLANAWASSRIAVPHYQSMIDMMSFVVTRETENLTTIEAEPSGPGIFAVMRLASIDRTKRSWDKAVERQMGYERSLRRCERMSWPFTPQYRIEVIFPDTKAKV